MILGYWIMNLFENIYAKVHAIYDSDENGLYCAAVDLFERGFTFRVYYEVRGDGRSHVVDIERWFIG